MNINNLVSNYSNKQFLKLKKKFKNNVFLLHKPHENERKDKIMVNKKPLKINFKIKIF
jgi:hypothetical protein